jgi:signal transduction histidine kinase
VFVDRGMWEKIVLNLISNAFKFTFEGSIAIALHKADDNVNCGFGIRESAFPPTKSRVCSTASIASKTRAAEPMKAAALAWRWCRSGQAARRLGARGERAG